MHNLSIRTALLPLILLLFASASTHAAFFDVTASYADGSTFSATYSDTEGDFNDGLCNSCTLISGSASLGSAFSGLESAPANTFVIDLFDLLNNSNTQMLVISTGAGAQFNFAFESSDPDTASLNQADVLGFTHQIANASNRYCEQGSAPNCAFVQTQFDSSGISSRNITVSTVPLPAAAWLFGTTLIALTGVRRKQR